jgi:hypothetical protein
VAHAKGHAAGRWDQACAHQTPTMARCLRVASARTRAWRQKTASMRACATLHPPCACHPSCTATE